MKTKLILSSAIAGLVALSSASGGAMAQEKKAEKEKCYGVAKKGAERLRHRQAFLCRPGCVADNVPEEWKYVAKGSCEKMGGKLKVAAAAAKDDKAAAPAKK